MSEENIILTAIIKTDIRNPVANLVFKAHPIGTPELTREIILRVFRNMSKFKALGFYISAEEILSVHSLHMMNDNKTLIDEIELIAENHSESEVEFSPTKFYFKKPSTTTIATLKFSKVKVFDIFPKKYGDVLLYEIRFSDGSGTSMVSY